ncbi:hypothetical protein ACOSQ3_023082 [Xanthoceras sorbifolium]
MKIWCARIRSCVYKYVLECVLEEQSFNVYESLIYNIFSQNQLWWWQFTNVQKSISYQRILLDFDYHMHLHLIKSVDCHLSCPEKNIYMKMPQLACACIHIKHWPEPLNLRAVPTLLISCIPNIPTTPFFSLNK